MRPRRGTVGAVLALLITAGCSGETGEASPSPSPSQSESATSGASSPSASAAPTMSALAEKPSDAGAVEFVRYYVDLVNHGAATGDVEELKDVAAPCVDCQRLAHELEDIANAGGSIEPPKMWIVQEVHAVAGAQGVVTAALREPSIVRIPSAGASPVRTKGGEFVIEFRLKHSSSGWTIREASRL